MPKNKPQAIPAHHTKGPLIYMLTFPSGRRYIGQTTRTFEERMKAHRNSVNAVKSCRLVKAAVKKYGWDSVKREILVVCDIDQVDEYETKFIGLYNTLAPNGYNLETGGHGNKVIPESSRKLMSEAQKRRDNKPFRRSEETKEFPKFIGKVNRRYSKGYKICKHPKCAYKNFCDKNKTDAENFQDAKDFLKRLDDGEIEVIPRPKKDLPVGLCKHGSKGYRVELRDPVLGRYSKCFGSTAFTPEQNYEMALEHLKIAPKKFLQEALHRLTAKLEVLMETNKRILDGMSEIEKQINIIINTFRETFND